MDRLQCLLPFSGVPQGQCLVSVQQKPPDHWVCFQLLKNIFLMSKAPHFSSSSSSSASLRFSPDCMPSVRSDADVVGLSLCRKTTPVVLLGSVQVLLNFLITETKTSQLHFDPIGQKNLTILQININ